MEMHDAIYWTENPIREKSSLIWTWKPIRDKWQGTHILNTKSKDQNEKCNLIK